MAAKKEDPTRAGPKRASDHVRTGSGFRRAIQIPEEGDADAFPPDEEPTAETDLVQLEHERALRSLSDHRSPPPTLEYQENEDEPSGSWDAITSKTDLTDEEVTATAPQPPSSAKMMAAPVVAYRPPVPRQEPLPVRRQEPLSSTKLSAQPPLPQPPPPPPPPPPQPLDVDVDSLAKAARDQVPPPRPPVETLPFAAGQPPPPSLMVSEREMLSLPFLPPPVVRRAFIAALQAQAPPPRRSPWLTFFVVLGSVIALAAVAYLTLVLTGHRPSFNGH